MRDFDAKKIIQLMGGRAQVMQITGLTKGRISQWITGNHIPHAWMIAFRAMQPSILDTEQQLASKQTVKARRAPPSKP